MEDYVQTPASVVSGGSAVPSPEEEKGRFLASGLKT